ncbi:Hypothetical predicted protein [Podarcis lilfordi]|uniref:Uncharacterized protein n=1 Tax=Podarcis lilfordi TaxID=74358 RepID=A0AA35P139_9SAUR|nr:Hypothetical predicted protein [Podarcis lilfordi]
MLDLKGPRQDWEELRRRFVFPSSRERPPAPPRWRGRGGDTSGEEVIARAICACVASHPSYEAVPEKAAGGDRSCA